jgi:hypothetical protein
MKDMMLNEVRTLSDGMKVRAVAATHGCSGCIGCCNTGCLSEEAGNCSPADREDAHDVIFQEYK